MKIYNISIASDHSGLLIKQEIIAHLSKMGHKVIDLGPYDDASVDYPDYANLLCENIIEQSSQFGILICRTGIGMSIAANRHSGVRAALCTKIEMAELARLHNDANVIVLGCGIVDNDTNITLIDKFLNTSFEGGRHIKRLAKIS
jgi:ribose 5-phosphate isomerase B